MATLKEKTAVSHEQYLQALKTWDNDSQSADECTIALKRFKKDLIMNFHPYKQITRLFVEEHVQWQIDTVQKLLQRDENSQTVKNFIRVQKPEPCQACSGKVHMQWACPQLKQLAQLRRYQLSRNTRKDNQTGDYACRKPFQLLKDTLIPQLVFDLYEKEFIPFHCE